MNQDTEPEKILRCEWCGEVIDPESAYKTNYDVDDEVFCTDYCAEMYWEDCELGVLFQDESSQQIP